MHERAQQIISLHDIVGLPLIVLTIIVVVYAIKHREHATLVETLAVYVLAISTLVIASREISVPLMLTGLILAAVSAAWLMFGMRLLIHEHDSENLLFFTLRIGALLLMIAIPVAIVKLGLAGPALVVAALVLLAFAVISFVRIERGLLVADMPSPLLLVPKSIMIAFAACWLLAGLTLGPNLPITLASLLWLAFMLIATYAPRRHRSSEGGPQ